MKKAITKNNVMKASEEQETRFVCPDPLETMDYEEFISKIFTPGFRQYLEEYLIHVFSNEERDKEFEKRHMEFFKNVEGLPIPIPSAAFLLLDLIRRNSDFERIIKQTEVKP